MKERHIEAASVIDDRVIGKNGIALGKLRDLLIDSREGRIDYACIALTTGQSSTQVAYVPWSQLRISPNGEVSLNVSRETLMGFSRWQQSQKEES